MCVCVCGRKGSAWRGGEERLEGNRGRRQKEGRDWEEKSREEQRNPVPYIPSIVPRPFKKWPGNLSEFKLLTSTALEWAVPIRFQNTSRDSCRISFVS